MSYIENIFVCLGAPLLVAAICARGKSRNMMLFLLAGMTMCLLSSYISTFIAAANNMSMLTASLESVPIIEEIILQLSLMA